MEEVQMKKSQNFLVQMGNKRHQIVKVSLKMEKTPNLAKFHFFLGSLSTLWNTSEEKTCLLNVYEYVFNKIFGIFYFSEE